jgi:hypothetical protein
MNRKQRIDALEIGSGGEEDGVASLAGAGPAGSPQDYEQWNAATSEAHGEF